MRNVKVSLGKDSYDICIGTDIADELQSFIRQAGFSRKALLVSDSVVGKLYGEKVLAILQEAGLRAELFLIEAGESSKSLGSAEKIYTKAIEMGLDRKSALFALGGGVVGDLAGFVAATYMRGIAFVQLPTSLLAQVDSSVGGKVAVNHRLGKNMIGAFYQPRAVFIDLTMLQSLPKREIYTGLAEIIKYGIIYDAEFFRYLSEHADALLRLDLETIAHVVARSCEIKAAVVSNDEREAGLRIILNFGHTLAHAIESETNYQKYNHGEAVAIGMIGAARLSRELGLIDEAAVKAVKAIVRKFHLPVKASGCTLEKMFENISHDKKTVNGNVQWVLMNEIGKVQVDKNVPDILVKKVIAEILI